MEAPIETAATETTATSARAPRKDYDFRFNGSGGEFFRIWIVNLLLTIVTLGIYSAWAKVRTNQYFYGNTFLDDSSFEYTADPVQILKGRIIAVIAIVAYQASGFFSTTAGLVAFAILMLLMPALVVFAMRFRMRYTRWRNLEFGFRPDFKRAYLIFMLPLLLLALSGVVPGLLGWLPDPQDIEAMNELAEETTVDAGGETDADASAEVSMEDLGFDTRAFGLIGASVFAMFLLYPVWLVFYYRFIADRSRFGNVHFNFVATIMEFYSIYLIAFLVALGAGLAAGAIVAALGALAPALAGTVGVAVMLLPALAAAAYINTQKANVTYGNLELADIGFRSELRFSRMFWLYLSNTVGIILTVGLFIPWAKVRMAKYRAETMTLFASDFDGFQARAGDDVSARAEEFSDLFDIDIGI